MLDATGDLDVDIRDEHGKTPLHFAKSAGVVNSLVRAGAGVNATDDSGNTPLHLIYGRQRVLELAQALVANGADPLVENYRGDTPLDVITFEFDLAKLFSMQADAEAYVYLVRAASIPLTPDENEAVDLAFANDFINVRTTPSFDEPATNVEIPRNTPLFILDTREQWCHVVGAHRYIDIDPDVAREMDTSHLWVLCDDVTRVEELVD